MQKQKKESKLPIIISILALVFSIISLSINYYNQYGKNAKLEFQMGNRLVCFSANQKLKCINTISIFNEGAQTGSIYKIKGELRNLTTNSIVHLSWDMFVQEENAGIKGKEFVPYNSFESWVKTILVPARSATQKEIQFRSIEDYDLIEGKYNLKLYYYVGTEKTEKSTTIFKFTVDKKGLDLWNNSVLQYDSLNKIAKASVTFNAITTENE